ncbi:ERG4/ERG24 ergosterol biosynthesis protein [Wilcoxina mikolae CBS 423.85]|nr:ERG4/ERG24 ergosterol biosynthesis protein [Wilcoxina mikolae CBS 423.85]
MSGKKINYQFGGPIGALGVTLGCPLLAYTLYFVCNDSGCPSKSFLDAPLETLAAQWPGLDGVYSHQAFGYYCAWFFGIAALQFILPGRERYGVELSDKSRLKYKLNVLETFLMILTYLSFMTYREGLSWGLWTWIWDNYLYLMTASLVFATIVAFYTYISSFFTGELLAEHGNTGNPLYDWFIGRPLNPRIGSFDLKEFSELRPGMILWPVLNFSYLAHQYQTLGRVTDSMIIVNIFQFWYVIDSFINEPAVLTTMDIATDGFGFMLSFGDLCWLPFVYSLQGRYLAMHPVDLGLAGIAGILAVQGLGYWVFRGSNGEKNKFRTNPEDPSLKHLKYLETKSGSKLLITGWWGVARHINYLGDWIMAWAWCLPTGFRTPVTYFYVVYFAVLLIHRDRRDDEKCRAKYGADWDRYTKIVPYRILPGVY